MVAELLDCGADVNTVASFENMSTLLENACMNLDLDMVRFLLRRGASTDHISSKGMEASVACWGSSDHGSQYTSMDIFKLVTEDNYPDLYGSNWRRRAIALASYSGSGSQVDTLVRLGVSGQPDKINHVLPIMFAAYSGNYCTYSTLLHHYDEEEFEHVDFVTLLLRDTIRGYAHHRARLRSNSLVSIDRNPEHDKIMANILQRGVDPEEWVMIEEDLQRPFPPSVQCQWIRAHKLAAAFGPETEAWYVSMVLSYCRFAPRGGKLMIRRLRGADYSIEDKYNEAHANSQSRFEVLDEELQETDLGEGSGDGDSGSDMDDGSIDGAISEAQEIDRFWDAPESV